ncbi:MAG: Crp/Fnr family transcriptional regulator [Pseudomonadota bacterium]
MSACSVREYAPGDKILRRGHKTDGLYGLISGDVRYTTVTAEGEEIILDYFRPGAWFADISALDGGKGIHDICAASDVRMAWLKISEIARLGEKMQDFYPTLIKLTCAHVRRLAAAFELIIQLSPHQLLAYRICDVSNRNGDCDEIKLRQADLAGLAGLSPRGVTKILNRWRDEGLIDTFYGGVRILDRQRLKAVWQKTYL